MDVQKLIDLLYPGVLSIIKKIDGWDLEQIDGNVHLVLGNVEEEKRSFLLVRANEMEDKSYVDGLPDRVMGIIKNQLPFLIKGS